MITGLYLIRSGSPNSFKLAGTENSEERTVSAEFACVGAPYKITECDALMFSDKIEVPYTRHWIQKEDRELKFIFNDDSLRAIGVDYIYVCRQ